MQVLNQSAHCTGLSESAVLNVLRDVGKNLHLFHSIQEMCYSVKFGLDLLDLNICDIAFFLFINSFLYLLIFVC